jgi:signal transduction histidine kinase
MAFKIAARTILELGSELISSDGVALYELIKNAIDAGSPQVEIRVVISLTHTNYLTLLEKIDSEEYGLNELKTDIIASINSTAPEIIKNRFTLSILRSTTVSELRSNLVRNYVLRNYISINDSGEGMSFLDLEQIYLTIGTRSRQGSSKAYLGEKGVGRLSAMRLGHLLSVKTSRAGELNYNKLEINWDLFSHDSNALLEEIAINPVVGEEKEDRQWSGTKIRINGLKADWTLEKFKTIIVNEFSRLVDPFESTKGNRIFRLFLNGERHFLPEIESRLFSVAHAQCTAEFYYDDKDEPVLSGYIDYRLRNKNISFHKELAELAGITSGHPLSALKTLGPFKVEFWWFNRLILAAVDGIGKKKDVLALVRRWSGGLMLFKDGFRINPYGGPDDDWLELDKSAFSSRGFKVNRQQIVGRVQTSSQNQFLIEQTNREGLTDTIQKLVFQHLLKYIVLSEFKVFLDAIDRETRLQELTSFDSMEDKIIKTESDIEQKISQISAIVPNEVKGSLRELRQLTSKLAGIVADAKQLAQEYQDDRSKFVYLAGLGLSVEFILHELGRATQHALATLNDIAPGNIAPEEFPSVLNTLTEQLVSINKRVETLDPMSTSRRQVKENFDPFEVVRQILDGRKAQASRHHIRIKGNYNEAHQWRTVKAVKGMFIQVIENIISNSFYWLKMQSNLERNFRPYIEVNLDQDCKTISVTDNGPGISPKESEKIFEAFVTSKPPGLGKGLGLYISREIAEYHDWDLYVLKEDTIRKGRYNTFIIDMSKRSK